MSPVYAVPWPVLLLRFARNLVLLTPYLAAMQAAGITAPERFIIGVVVGIGLSSLLDHFDLPRGTRWPQKDTEEEW